MQNFDNQTIQLILIAVVVLAMLFQSIVLISLTIAMRKATRTATQKIEEVHSSVMPIIENSRALIQNSRALIERLTPKIETAGDDLTAMAHSLRIQTDDLQVAANEVIARVRSQTSRLDAITTNLLNGVDRAGHFMSDTVTKPMRQVSAILASIKAAVETLRAAEPGPRSHPVHTPGDNDMFV